MSTELPRRVLHVLNGAGGGAAMSTCGLAEALADHGITSSAVCHSAGTSAERAMVREAFAGRVLFAPLYFWHRRSRAKLWKRPLIEARQLIATGWGRASRRWVAEFAAKQEVELIHTNTILNPEGAAAAQALGLAHVWHLRELVGPGNPFRMPREGASFGRYLRSRCSVLVANSHFTARTIDGWLDEDQLRVVENGIDLSQFEVCRPRTRTTTEPLIVAMVANLSSRWKQHHLVLEAAALLDPTLAIELRLYGHASAGDPYVEELRRRSRALGLGERLRFCGFVEPPSRIMAEIDLLVHPTAVESFGRIVVEAMAAGLPVVGVADGGVGELVEDGVTGLLVPPNNAQALATAIERLASDSDLRQSLGKNGRQRAEQRYSLENCAGRMAKVYRRAMARPLGRSRTNSQPGATA